VADGTIAVVGSDHNSRRRERKEGSIWKASAGFPGVSTLLPIMLGEGHHRRGLALERIVEVLCSNPARVFGLYPRKGTIAVGSDADLTLVDLDREGVVDSSAYESHADYSTYDGWTLRGWPVATVVRGEVVMREGEILADAGHGVYLPRVAESRAGAGRVVAGSVAHG
jgi:dihydropyrimidinase